MRISKINFGKWVDSRSGILMKLSFGTESHILMLTPSYGANYIVCRIYVATLYSKGVDSESIKPYNYGVPYEIGWKVFDKIDYIDVKLANIDEPLKQYAIKKAIHYFEFEYKKCK